MRGFSGSPTLLELLSFGLLQSGTRRRAAKFHEEMQAAGDLSTWPFLSERDLEEERRSQLL